MKRFILGLLVVTNLVLAGLLALRLASRQPQEVAVQGTYSQPSVSEAATDQPTARPASTPRRASASSNSVPTTPFTKMYSQDATAFAGNLRGIGCPEETVKDILVAEINRRYRAREEALRPKPADHVPFTWSANPSERKLMERRQQAAAIAREKRVLIREAFGYEVPVAMPVYAMTVSAQRFEDSLGTLTPDKRSAVVKAHEDYWARVQALQERTKGFWQSDDVAELERFKKERQEIIESLAKAP